jgi:hypothetical protein
LLPKNSANFNFQFKKDKLRNTMLAYNIDKENLCAKFFLEPNGGWNLCTLEIVYMFQEIATDGELNSDFKMVRT